MENLHGRVRFLRHDEPTVQRNNTEGEGENQIRAKQQGLSGVCEDCLYLNGIHKGQWAGVKKSVEQFGS